jgi:hypothetical protein
MRVPHADLHPPFRQAFTVELVVTIVEAQMLFAVVILPTLFGAPRAHCTLWLCIH